LVEVLSSHIAVGNTLFLRSRNVERQLPCKSLFLKFEGGNPTGTQKDRISTVIIEEALKHDYRDVSVATCGNYGASIAYFAQEYGLRSHIFIPQKYHTKRLEEIEAYRGLIYRVEGSYEDSVSICEEDSQDNNWFNASPNVKENYRISRRAYARISEEILASLGNVPDVVSVPVGNGTTLSGIHYGFKLLRKKGDIDRVPMLIASSTSRGNPIIESFREDSASVMDLKPEDIKETEVNEPLVNWHSFDGQSALDALYETNGHAYYASDQRMNDYATLLLMEEGLSVLPASCSALAAISQYINEFNCPETYVAILTGRKPVYRKSLVNLNGK